MIKTMILDLWRRPILICDGCGKKIEKSTDGLVIEKEDGSVEFRHKFFIKKGCTVRNGTWVDIDVFFHLLIHDLKIDMRAGEQRARMLGQL